MSTLPEHDTPTPMRYLNKLFSEEGKPTLRRMNNARFEDEALNYRPGTL